MLLPVFGTGHKFNGLSLFLFQIQTAVLQQNLISRNSGSTESQDRID